MAAGRCDDGDINSYDDGGVTMVMNYSYDDDGGGPV